MYFHVFAQAKIRDLENIVEIFMVDFPEQASIELIK